MVGILGHNLPKKVVPKHIASKIDLKYNQCNQSKAFMVTRERSGILKVSYFCHSTYDVKRIQFDVFEDMMWTHWYRHVGFKMTCKGLALWPHRLYNLWWSPIVVIPKLPGSSWLCNGRRWLNEILAFDSYLLPWVDVSVFTGPLTYFKGWWSLLSTLIIHRQQTTWTTSLACSPELIIFPISQKCWRRKKDVKQKKNIWA